jgi:hypothetical protein
MTVKISFQARGKVSFAFIYFGDIIFPNDPEATLQWLLLGFRSHQVGMGVVNLNKFLPAFLGFPLFCASVINSLTYPREKNK